ncbi:MAG: ATP-dependent sacrificial sulfur transferase LarE [Nitrososphaerales archaeon]
MELSSTTQRKLDKLTSFFKDKKRVLVAFSGGVDSSLVTMVAKIALRDDVMAVTVNSTLFPPLEIQNSKRIAEKIGVRHRIVDIDLLANSFIYNNPPNRCYYCKKEIITTLKKIAKDEGMSMIVDGTNTDDLKKYRPGALALKEEGVYSPLAIIGVSKREVREIASYLGLPNYDKPSMTCFASRFPYHQKITREGVLRISEAENYIISLLGAKQVRVRDHNGIARIELGKDERKLLYDEVLMDKIVRKLKSLGFNYITMDLQGYRSGSMDEVL